MLIRVMSDIHHEHDMRAISKQVVGAKFWSPVELETDKETTLILPGDLWNGLYSIDCIQSFHNRFKEVWVVLGNHDYWYNNLNTLNDNYKRELINYRMDNVSVLDADTFERDGKLFIGCSLFTNMDRENPLCIARAKDCMQPDFTLIKSDEELDEFYINRVKTISVEDWLQRNARDFDYIKNVVANNKDKEIIIVTHYGCSTLSIHEKYKQYGLSNYYFVNDYWDFIHDNENIKYWIHGHIHSKMDYNIGECRVIANPRGYPGEHTEFDEISLYVI